ncbi:MAG: rod shape-determining protein RodA [Deltaproteobacteria bacterium]|nr:rod shape-determining protein RodA [Deltaproteobacteria bacterium]MBW2019682.1 rod shape-determining protein RodA [Deltaproteobacteria bacterium]MBW2074462.1 rod shape-determining protein RodA [Deltaproteobacteria bacterium]RLB81680.1 MAG: rod shape-determining protein RodA [Deltaproteobacteria bacterium]
MFDRRLLQHFDWVLLGLTFALGGIGILTLYSAATANVDVAEVKGLVYLKQSYWLAIGTAVMILLVVFNYRWLNRLALPIYWCSIGLLIAVLFMGKEVSGSQRWLVLGPISFQPSELVKITLAIILARYFSNHASEKGFSLKELWKPLIWTLIPFALIVKQPDLGTSLIVLLIAASVTIFVKIGRRSLLCLTVAGIAGSLVAWFFLKGYQKQRILAFLDPQRDPLGAGYHIIQSKIAVGSGLLFGKGFLKGTQNALSFLPEQHTDFIFSVLAEEWGFLGSAVVVILYLLVVMWGLSIAIRSKEPFGTILAVGVTSMIFWQAFINMGMVLALLPVVGVPLPLISYGGSSVLATMVAIGILLNISMRRFLFKE